MAQQYSREVLRRSVAHVCQLIGWHAVQAGPLDVLVHVLEKYLLALATQARRHAEHGARTEPTLADLARAFAAAGVRLAELREYARAVPACPPRLRPPAYPLPAADRLHFLKPGSAEVLSRPVHVHEHLPPMLAERPAEAAGDGPEDDKRFKRPVDPVSAAKKPRLRPPDDCHARELSSVMMTTSGFLSPAREGKLPEARTPTVVPDVPSDRKPAARPEFAAVAAAAARPRPDRRPKKSKAPNGKIEKAKRRDKTAKRLSNERVDLENEANELPVAPDRPKSPTVVESEAIPARRPLFYPAGPAVAKAAPDVKPKNPPLSERTVTPSFVNNVAKPPPPDVARPPVVVKEEKPDPEKPTAPPDRLKLDVFKKISTKSKEERRPPAAVAKREPVAVKIERASPEPTRPVVPLFERKSPPRPAPAFREEDFDAIRRRIKLEPPDDPPSEAPAPLPKLSLVPQEVLTGAPKRVAKPTAKEKREKKQKEKALREERVMREYKKMLKERPEFDSATPFDVYGGRFPFPSPALGMYPNFPTGMPTPGLIPSTPNVYPFPAFRGLRPPTSAPNPFSTGGPASANFLPGGPGLIPQNLVNPPLTVNRAFGRAPNIPAYLRRPSLEVIPIEDDGEARTRPSRPFVDSGPSIKEREKPKSGFLADGATSTPTVKPSPKANPVISVPPIEPDVTIKLNAPARPKPPEVAPSPAIETPPSPLPSKERDKSEKKKDKPHKKEKKDREQKIKKKKDKKDRLKLKLERKKEKEEKQELKEKIKKEKKEKRKEKEKQSFPSCEGVVPKLTLKLGPPSPMLPPSPDATKKLNIKPVVRKDDSIVCAPRVSPTPEIKRSESPELVQFSPLITRPPKVKSSKHRAEVDGGDGDPARSPPSRADNSSPARKSKPPSAHAKHKRIVFKHVPKRNSGDFDDPIIDLASAATAPDEPAGGVPDVPPGTAYYVDAKGERVWICPGCGRPDNGTPMIGCDGCDAWYHWVCVGIHVPPEDEVWYCKSCIAKRTAQASAQAAGHGGKKRGRKPKADKLKEKMI